MIGPQAPLLLASGSPRRRDLLAQLGIDLLIRPPQVDESVLPGETASQYVARVSFVKFQEAQRCWHLEGQPIAGILTADTVVAVDEQILTKPADVAQAEQMLNSLSGRSHQVMSAYCLWSVKGDVLRKRLVSTDVHFRELRPLEAQRYAQSGEGLDKAGAYAIQGGAAAFARRLDGSYSNVVGLPVSELLVDLYELALLEPAALFPSSQQ